MKLLSVILLAAIQVKAGELPELLEKPWLGSWIANDQREFDYSVGAKDARGRIYPKVRKNEGDVHAGIHDKFQIIFVLEELVRGKWVRRMMTEDGFETDQEASAEVESCEFVATYEGGSKARIRHRFERKRIIISTELMHKASNDPVRVGVLIYTPKVHNVLEHRKEYSEDEIEEFMEDDEIRALRVDGKAFRFKLHEMVKLSDSEVLADGATEFSLEVKRYGGKPISVSSAAKGGGKIIFSQSGRLFEPIRATWYPSENKKPAQGAELVIEFK